MSNNINSNIDDGVNSSIDGSTNAAALNDNYIDRYDRHIVIKAIKREGQEKLHRAKVLVIGAGGLGSPVIMYLAAAGVGTIGIADNDCVELSNLQRQIAHNESRLGVSKAESAAHTAELINRHINVITYPVRLTPDNISDIISGYDFIIDAVDNFSTKFLINDACVIAGKPFCHGGVTGFGGQAMTYVPDEGPCYRCIFEEIPEKGSVPDCRQEGIIGAVAGVIGSIQALEAVKYVTGAGNLLTGRMLVFDGLNMKFRNVVFEKPSPGCRVCAKNADIKNVAENKEEYM